MARRTVSGISMVEVLVATIVMSFVASGMLGLAYLNWKTGQRIENKSDGVSAARQAVDKLGFEIRQARSVGDFFGVVTPPTQRVVEMDGANDTTTDLRVVHADALPQGQVEQGIATLSSPTFPAPGNPQYDGTNATATGWEDASPTVPYALSNQCLIVQKPIFSDVGFPRAYAGAGLTQPIECVDTMVYRVVPDSRPDHPGEWLMQVAGFPGEGSAMINPRQAKTVLTGIVGPMDNNGRPRVFQYLLSSKTAPLNSVNWYDVHDVSGVVVHLEIRRSQASGSAVQSGGQQAFLAIKQEIYLRNNSLTSVTATPQ